MKHRNSIFIKYIATLVFSFFSTFASNAQPSATIANLTPSFDGYYTKLLDCDGIMIRSSNVVDDKALEVAAGKIRMMLTHIPAAKHNLAQWGAEIHIIGRDQQTSDLPEFADQKGVSFVDNLGHTTNIDIRTRGMGGIYTSCGEENLLNLPNDRYRGGQDICIHEFAHNIMFYGLNDTLRRTITAQYKKAKAAGLWKDAYAMVDAGEYWAELSMWYFGKHGEFLKGTRIPAPGPATMRAYDKDGFFLLDSIYSGKSHIPKIDAHAPKKVPAGTKTDVNGTGDEATFMITNNTGQKLKLYWLDYDGKPKPYGQAKAYNSFKCATYRGHVWEIRDQQDKLLGCYQMDKPNVRVVF